MSLCFQRKSFIAERSSACFTSPLCASTDYPFLLEALRKSHFVGKFSVFFLVIHKTGTKTVTTPCLLVQLLTINTHLYREYVCIYKRAHV